MTSKVTRSEAEWRQSLSPEQYRILREHGTERAFSHPLNDEKREGVFRCAGCGEALFDSRSKFNSGTGWPSFAAPLSAAAVEEKADNSWFMRRTEVLCASCGGHLGHVFNDGPKPTGLRYCMNGTALDFRPTTTED
jgi:peptide-methionine (R)-S-oxide reductase